MPPASSGGAPSGESSSNSASEDGDRERERGEEKGSGSIRRQSHRHHHLPLASTSSPADDAAAASALSAALLPLLPPASAAWAYGSGVFSQQPGGAPSGPRGGEDVVVHAPPRPSVDLLLAVADPERWHEDNLRRNPHHYSPLARGFAGGGLLGSLGGGGGAPSSGRICWFAESVGPGVWFNSGVRVGGGGGAAGGGAEEGRRRGGGGGAGGGGGRAAASSDSDSDSATTLKYGVFSERALLADLESWGELYLAGRLQKPTLRLPLPTPPAKETTTAEAATEEEEAEAARGGTDASSFASRLEAALERNAAAALAAALLLLPATFSHSRLLSTLVSLSYSGDVRLAAAAEDPRKVERIVLGTGRARLDGLYSRHLPFPCPLSSSSSVSSSASSSSSSSASSSPASSSSSVASAAGLVPLCGGNAWAQDPRRESRRELVGLLPEGVQRKVVAEERRAAFFPSPSSSSSSSSFSSSLKRSPSYFSPSPPSLLASSVRAALASGRTGDEGAEVRLHPQHVVDRAVLFGAGCPRGSRQRRASGSGEWSLFSPAFLH